MPEGEGEDADSDDINGTPMPPTPPRLTGNEESGNESGEEKDEDEDLKEPEGRLHVHCVQSHCKTDYNALLNTTTLFFHTSFHIF